MTTPPDWAVGVDDAVHRIPGGQIQPEPPFSWQQLGAFVQFALDTFIGKIAIAFGGISILGWRPLDYLTEWGQERIDQASENYLLAVNAQRAATLGLSQVTALSGAALATDVSGGVAVNAGFNEPVATSLAGFTRYSDGSGAGTCGPDGAGSAAWVKSGGLFRRHLDVFDTPLATDYQAVLMVTSTPVQAPYLGSQAYTYLIARCDAAGQNFIWARIGVDSVAVGETVSGTWATAWDSESVTTNAGDQWTFLVGTDSDDRQLIVKQNGVVRLNYTDTSSSALCSDAHATVADHDGSCTRYYYTGIASAAADRAILIIPLLDQTVPAEVDLWAAADRLATST